MPPLASALDAVPGLGDRAFFRVDSRTEPDQLEAGTLASSLNGRMEKRSWQPRKALSNLSGALQVEGDPLRLPFFLVDTVGGLTLSSAERTGEVVTLEVASHPFEVGAEAYLGVESLTGSEDPNGVHLVTVVDANFLTFEIEGAVGSELYSGTGKIRSVLDDAAAAAIWGSCVYSDPESLNAESIILAASGVAYKVDTADGTVTELAYPVGGSLTSDVHLLHAFDRVYLFRDGAAAWECLQGASAFTAVASDAYTQPQVFEVTGTAVVVASGLCTLTVVGNTTVATGDTGKLYASDDPHFEPFVGRDYKVTFADATTIKFYIPVEDLATISTNTLSFGKPVSQGLGFIHQPGAPWGVYHQRRLWLPYFYAPGAGPAYTDRDVRDEIVASDVLDPDTYDVGLNQFRITAGTANYLVALHAYAEDRLLAFMRNSIHAVDGVSGSLADCSTTLLTEEVGCLARRSIAQYAKQVLFLADDGVRALGFVDEVNLRPLGEPLSAPIQPIIDRISPDLAPFSVGVYFSNRYWLAVPLDSAPGAGDATGNNAILVFNFLNGGWESVDSVADPRWKVLNLHISAAGARNDLYVVNDLGGVHKIDATDDDHDTVALTPGNDLERIPVDSGARTRQYGGDSPERKRWTQFQVQVESAGQASDADLSFETQDPDNSGTLGSISTLTGELLEASESASLRARVGGYRGQGISLIFTPTVGRPKLKTVSADATETNRSTTNQK